MRFQGKVALITAAGRGIGLAVAEELAKGGATLVLNDIDGPRLAAAADTLRGYDARLTTHVGSVTDEGFIARMVAEAEKAHGKVDLLLNNAGGAPPQAAWGPFAAASLADFRAFMELNFFSQAMLMRALLPGMVARKYGKVVCVSSISAVIGQENGSAYAAGKAALHGLVTSVAKEVGRHGVNVNTVILGNPPHPSRSDARQDYLNRLSHMDRVGSFEEFGKAIAFLLSDDASYMSGALVPIDGGLLTPRLNE